MTHRLRRLSSISLVALLFFVAGCASAGGTSGGTRRNANTLQKEEMQASGVATLYDAVVRLRPRWLDTRDALQSTSEGGSRVVVFQDQSLLGNPEILKQYSIDSVIELRYLDGTKATSTLPVLGSRQVKGAIIMVTGTR